MGGVGRGLWVLNQFVVSVLCLGLFTLGECMGSGGGGIEWEIIITTFILSNSCSLINRLINYQCFYYCLCGRLHLLDLSILEFGLHGARVRILRFSARNVDKY